MTGGASRGRQKLKKKVFAAWGLYVFFTFIFSVCSGAVTVFIHVRSQSRRSRGSEASVRAHDDSIKVLEGEERRRDQREETQVELIHTPPTRVSTFSAAAGVKLDFRSPDWNSKHSLRGNRK